jgi:hypothetical protein
MTSPKDNETNLLENAVAEGGAYEVIRKRLLSQGRDLDVQTRQLNESRIEEFGRSEMGVSAHTRVRTENNCIARDIVQIGDHLLFGYNVFIGLKQETSIADVFALFRLVNSEDGSEMETLALNDSFLAQTAFLNDFEELYRYYKHARLMQLTIAHGKLLAEFQTGEQREDIRVFRWSVSADGQSIEYIDNRGERDIELPPAFDFEWLETGREHFVNGRFPHVNILDTVFVETIQGDLTVKIENNTEDGLGIFQEAVEDETQSLDDADIFYSALGNLILIKVLPYREQNWRYLIYNKITHEVIREDAIGESCVQLPEDHGIIFPGGYYLQNGEYKTFTNESQGLRFKRKILSPNGEDVLYVFYQPDEGTVGLFAYNLISKDLQNPLYAHGHALAENGTLVIFSAEGEPARIHPMQVWNTPFVTREFASKTTVSQNFYGRVGNAELVRGISDLYSILRLIDNQQVSSLQYENLGGLAAKMFDSYYWIIEEETGNIGELLKKIASTAELVVDEFEKAQNIRQTSSQALADAQQSQEDILQTIHSSDWKLAEDYVGALKQLRQLRGHLATIKEYRYIDRLKIDAFDQELTQEQETLSQRTVDFLAQEDALIPYIKKIEALNTNVEKVNTAALLQPLLEDIESTGSGLDMMSELMATLKVNDATIHTRIIDEISEVYAKLNQSKANASHKLKNLGSEEAKAQFAAQFKLFSQSITNALGMAKTPDACDEQLSRLLIQLEELESQFSQYDQFLTDILEKREEIHESFETHKQKLLDERQRKAQAIADAATRMLVNIERRSMKFDEADDLNTYFASDALVLKTKELILRLHELESAVMADDIEARFKAISEQALRALRDKSDIFEQGGKVIRLGPRHKFSVNTQDLDLTIIPRGDELYTHLSGTDYYEVIEREELRTLNSYWDRSLESESPIVYRSQYLAYQILKAAKQEQNGLDMENLNRAAIDQQALAKIVEDFARPRYKEGYERGIHDHDSSLILAQLLPALEGADLLRFSPKSRALAQVFWSNKQLLFKKGLSDDSWVERAQSAKQMFDVFASSRGIIKLGNEIKDIISEFLVKYPIDSSDLEIYQAAQYLVSELGREHLDFISNKNARELVDELKRSLDNTTWRKYQDALTKMQGFPDQRWHLSTSWLQALVKRKQLHHLSHYIEEAAALINTEERIGRRLSEADLDLTINGLMGNHVLIKERSLSFSIDEFLSTMEHHEQYVVPDYFRYLQLRKEIIITERKLLQLENFKARPLSSFVRNKLINDAYLPFIGDNLAKQMGTIGEDKRSDLMGLLIMISPPGYGKTTLMEYVANRLGLVFMKINCPSLGHDVLSLDPQQAPNATSAQELRKLNLALEMGNNVMLYLDDIQHTHPEFLQKFISLCDGTRRIEGVWKKHSKTYDMRGKKFCVVMAGNPYTESGESFKIPDMLANRADIYNLGDVLGGMDEQFKMSYIENCLTSNKVLAPLAVREMDDVYKLIKMAAGANIPATELSYQYSGAEINEIKEVLAKLFVVRDVILSVNQQYIYSAAQDDRYRTEPQFKLQGSYRNMNKMAEKVSSVMNQQELKQMISDHYVGEAQLLTTGAEHNLLKLALLRGDITTEQQQRWDAIIKDFLRKKAMGGDDADAATRVTSQLLSMSESLNLIQQVISDDNTLLEPVLHISQHLKTIQQELATKQTSINIENHPSKEIEKALQVMANTIETTFLPVVASMDKKIDLDLNIVRKVSELSNKIQSYNEKKPKS